MKWIIEVKKAIYWIILILLVYGFIELFSYGGLSFLSKFRHVEYKTIDTISDTQKQIINRFIDNKTNYITFDPTLGWSIKKNGLFELYQANSSGIRGDREYAITPPHGVRRISTFGDSFTHCDEVKNNETWQAAMESYDSNIEVINFGVCAFGLDQSYLRYLEDGRKYKSNIVLIGFMSENIKRNVNTYRPFYLSGTGFPFAKPRFLVKDGSLSLIPNPMKTLHDYKMLLLRPRDTLSKIGENDYYYKRNYSENNFDWLPIVKLVTILIQEYHKKSHNDNIIINDEYNINSEAYEITTKIFDEFYNGSIKNQSIPIILIFPYKYDIDRYRIKDQKCYSALLEYFDSVGYKYIDLMEAFDKVDIEELFLKHHYSPLANKLVAKCILNHINNMKYEEN